MKAPTFMHPSLDERLSNAHQPGLLLVVREHILSVVCFVVSAVTVLAFFICGAVYGVSCFRRVVPTLLMKHWLSLVDPRDRTETQFESRFCVNTTTFQRE